MTDRLNEIKERLDRVDACSVKHYICAGCEGDIETADARWLIAELEKERAKNNCPTCNFFRKDHDCGKQIETVTEFRCGTETVYKDGTKDFEWSE